MKLFLYRTWWALGCLLNIFCLVFIFDNWSAYDFINLTVAIFCAFMFWDSFSKKVIDACK